MWRFRRGILTQAASVCVPVGGGNSPGGGGDSPADSPADSPPDSPGDFVWPGVTNTGVPDGTTLTPYAGPMQITSNNTVIDSKQIDGQLDIRASNVIIRKCQISYTDAWGIYGELATGLVTIEDCTITGAGAGGFSVASYLGEATFRRNNVSGSSMGINCQGVCTVEFNWIHDLARQPGDHYDGISMMGSNHDSLVKDNLIEMPGSSVTAHVFITGQFAACSDNRIEHNRMTGSASFPIYSETNTYPVSGTVVVDNEMVQGDYGDGTFFASYVYDNGNSVTHSGNKTLTGVALD